MASAMPDNARQEIEDVIGIDASDAVLASAKTGLGVEDILEAIIQRIPAPKGDAAAPLKCNGIVMRIFSLSSTRCRSMCTIAFFAG